MKVVLKSIIREIQDAIFQAQLRGRSVEHIELTPSEWNEFVNERLAHGLYTDREAREILFDGVLVKAGDV